MSDSISCRKPFEAATVTEEGATAILKVGEGSEMRQFTVPVELLCKGSKYFRERLHNRDEDMASRPLAFPREDPELVDIFISFLHHGRIPLMEVERTTVALHILARLFALANEFESKPLRNTVLDEFLLRIAPRETPLLPRTINHVYENTGAESALRDLVVDVVVNIGTKDMVKYDSADLPSQFLADCLVNAAEDGVVPFECKTEGEAEVWLERKKESMCEEYHWHETRRVRVRKNRAWGRGRSYVPRRENEDMEEDEDDDVNMGEDENVDMEGEGDEDVEANENGDEAEGSEPEAKEYEASEQTKRELAFLEELKKRWKKF